MDPNQRNEADKATERMVTAPVRAGGRQLKGAAKKKLASAAKKAVHAAGSALLKAGKVLLVKLAPLLLALLGIFVAVGIIYTVLIKPVGVYQELKAMQEDGDYSGETLAVYLDVEEEWDEQLDGEAIELYETFKEKDLEGLDDFQLNQAKQFSLPYSIITSIERLELFAWGDQVQEMTGLEKWEPRPDEVFEALKTNYSWIDSEVTYKASYDYSYSYSYNYEVYHPPVYDEMGNVIREGYYEEKTETGEGSATQNLEIPFNVKLLDTADAFDNFYVHEYGDYEADRDIAMGSRSYRVSDSGTGIRSDSIEAGFDGYEGLLLNLGLADEVISDAESEMRSIQSGFKSGAYNIDLEFDFDINDATKYYQPLQMVSPEGEPFERIEDYLKERYSLNEVQEIDLRTILEIAADHDEEFAYNFVAHSDGFAFFGDMNSYYYSGIIGGTRTPMMVEATAYCNGTPGTGCPIVNGHPYCTGAYTDGYTATGKRAIAGDGSRENPHLIAVDRNVIPLGTTVYIPGLGYAVAEDVGGAIKGNRIDILFATHAEALKFGRQNIQIQIISNGLGWPVPIEVEPYITSHYGPRWGRIHYGIDIGGWGQRVPIVAAADGVVSLAGPNGTYGNCIIIKHGKNDQGKETETLYAHLHRVNVRPGDRVGQGQVIGTMGTTGRSTGIHLHYEVRVDGAKLDPLNFYDKNEFAPYLRSKEEWIRLR